MRLTLSTRDEPTMAPLSEDSRGPSPSALPLPPPKLMRCPSRKEKLLLQAALQAMEASVITAQRELARRHSSNTSSAILGSPLGPSRRGSMEVPPVPPSLVRRHSTPEHTLNWEGASDVTGSGTVTAQWHLSHYHSSGWLMVERALEIEKRAAFRPMRRGQWARLGSITRRERASSSPTSDYVECHRQLDPAAAEARLQRFRQSLDEARRTRIGRLLDEPTHRLLDWGGRLLKTQLGVKERAGVCEPAACVSERSSKEATRLDGIAAERSGKNANRRRSSVGSLSASKSWKSRSRGQLHAELLELLGV